MSDIVKHGGDGYDGFEDRVQSASGEGETPRGPIQGGLVTFTNEGTWLVKNDPAVPIASYELIAVDVLRLVQRWQNKKAETRVLQPGEPVPDIAELNASVPIEQWEIGPSGQRTGPFQFCYCLYLFHEPTVRKFTFITGTVGGGIAVRELVDAVKWFRKWRQGGVCPIVRLGSAHMNTRFGGRERPSFNILRWVKPNDGQGEVAVLAPRDPPQLSGDNGNQKMNDNVSAEQHKQAVGEAPVTPLQTVEPASLREEMSDELPF